MDFIQNLQRNLQNYFQPKQLVAPVPQNEQLTNPAILHWYANDQSRQQAARQPVTPQSTQPIPSPTRAMANYANPQPSPTLDLSSKNAVLNLLKGVELSSPVDRPQVRAASTKRVMDNYSSPTPTPTPTPKLKEYQQVYDNIVKGFNEYGNPPAATVAATYAEEAMKYPILRQHPGLLPAMALKETSGGKADVKNWHSWAIHDPNYQEKDPKQVIRDVAKALGSDSSSSSNYYKKFRETGNIMDMLNRYAPPGENNTELYHKQILDWKRMFEG